MASRSDAPRSREILPPRSLEKKHSAFFRRFANLAVRIANRNLNRLPHVFASARTDARRGEGPSVRAPGAIREFVDDLRAEYNREIDLEAAIVEIAETQARLDRAHRARWLRSSREQIERDPTLSDDLADEIRERDPEVSEAKKRSWVSTNADAIVLGAGALALSGAAVTGIRATLAPSSGQNRTFGGAKSVPEQFFDRIQARLTISLRRGDTPSQALDAIRAEPGIARRRARGIGEDQAEKWFATASEERFRKVGVLKYRWNHQNDAKVRPAHRARGGKIFAWTRPPPDGHPGEPPNCRCWASGDFRHAARTGLLSRTRGPTAIRPGRQRMPPPVRIPSVTNPGQIAFLREVFEAPVDPIQRAQEEIDRQMRIRRRRTSQVRVLAPGSARARRP